MNTLRRQSDVEAKSVKLEPESKLIVFEAQKGKSLDLVRLHAGLQETRMSGKPPGNTNAQLNYLEITVVGEVAAGEKGLLLKVSGTKQQFLLIEDESAKKVPGTPTPMQQIQAALEKGTKVTSVTGQVEGWCGHFPKVLRELAGEPAKEGAKPDKPVARQPARLIVTGFALAGA